MFRPLMRRWLAFLKTPSADDYFVKPGWILVTRSGSVGRCVLVSKRLVQFFVSEDLIRIVPVLPAGYLYAYLSSWVGQALMVRAKYGMTVTHLEPHHLAQLPVPLLPNDKQLMIHEKIMEAYRLRDEANVLLDKADELLHAELGLPHFDESEVSYLQDHYNEPPLNPYRPLQAFEVKASELAERFDASFHNPIVKAVIEQLRQGKYPLVQLNKVVACIFIPPRFKRVYVVSREHGVPFLEGSHVPMMKPYDLKYLSYRANERYIRECLIHEDWVLVTRSGTVGRLMLVPKALEGWAASEHCLRIVANPERLHPGYLVAFLMTPYGQHQLASKIYGGVVDELTEADVAAVWLPDAPLDIQLRIGALVKEAFEKKEEANKIESQAVEQLEQWLNG